VVGPDEGAKQGAGTSAGAAELDSRALQAISEEISRDCAPQLEHTALVLYDRDPDYLQAQWYVTQEELAQASSLFHDQAGLRQVLRLRRLDQDGKAEVVASTPQGSAQSKGEGQEGFALQGDGAEYECELGLESDTGGWLVLARSNRIRLADRSVPPAPPAPIGAAPDDLQAQGLPHSSAAGSYEDDEVPVEAALAAVNEPLYPVFPSLELEDSPVGSAIFAAQDAPRQPDVGRARPESPNGAERQPVQQMQIPIGTHPGENLATMPPPLLPSTPEPERPPELLGALYDPRAALSSAALRGARPPRLDLEIQAELIVHGRVSPGSRVELFGHAVQVDNDGRFSIRRPVEDPLLLSLAVVRHPEPGQASPEAE